MKKESKYKLTHDGLECQYCGKICKNRNSLCNHERLCKKNPSHQESKLKNQGWARGLTAETDERIKHGVEKKLIYYKNHKGEQRGKHKHSKEYIEHLRKYAIDNHIEDRFGKRKVYEYEGVKFISSYELAVARELDKNNIIWEKPIRFKYRDSKNKLHHYTPDFYLPDYNVYLDPKNDYLINNINPTFGYSDLQKIKWVEDQNKIIIIILDKNNLTWENIFNLINNRE